MEYGQTQDGMAYGLEGVQLSKNVMAYWAEKVEHDTGSGLGANILEFIVGIMDGFLNFSGSSNELFSKSGKEPYFDFYMSRDNFPVNKLDSNVDKTLYARDYKGIEFNKEIATTLRASTDSKAKIDGIILTEDPKSAFAYCYHKNKRNANGVVENQKWFLPAIDEIEEIALGAYDEFDKVFQNQKYWSCQPVNDKFKLSVKVKINILVSWDAGTLTADYYNDNIDRARATSVYTTNGTTYEPISSAAPGYLGTQNGRGQITNEGSLLRPNYIIKFDMTQEGGYVGSNIPDSEYNKHEGNLPRTTKCRIRAVYRSGTK